MNHLPMNYGHHEKSALPRPLANADAGLDMSLNRYFQGKPVFFVVPLCQSLSEEVQALENAIIIRLIDKFIVMRQLPRLQLL